MGGTSSLPSDSTLLPLLVVNKDSEGPPDGVW